MSLQVTARWAQRGLDVDLTLPAGRHALAGPNGAGKSSLLSVIAAMLYNLAAGLIGGIGVTLTDD